MHFTRYWRGCCDEHVSWSIGDGTSRMDGYGIDQLSCDDVAHFNEIGANGNQEWVFVDECVGCVGPLDMWTACPIGFPDARISTTFRDEHSEF
jgi:hypothetical protein